MQPEPHDVNRQGRPHPGEATLKTLSDRAAELGLTEDELAFYDAVAANPSALHMGEDVLQQIARHLYRLVSEDVTVDWRIKEQARDRIRAKVQFLLNYYGYPPDKAPDAIDRVLKQTEVKAEEWA